MREEGEEIDGGATAPPARRSFVSLNITFSYGVISGETSLASQLHHSSPAGEIRDHPLSLLVLFPSGLPRGGLAFISTSAAGAASGLCTLLFLASAVAPSGLPFSHFLIPPSVLPAEWALFAIGASIIVWRSISWTGSAVITAEVTLPRAEPGLGQPRPRPEFAIPRPPASSYHAFFFLSVNGIGSKHHRAVGSLDF